MTSSEPIAIIGSGCRFAGGVSSPSEFWSLLRDPIDLSTKVPTDRFNIDAFYHPDSKHHGTTNIRNAYCLSEDIRRFDAPFFNISAVEAESIDPQQRLLLETVYEAVERAGIRPASLQGSQTGAFCGTMTDDYNQILHRDIDHAPLYTATGLARNNLSNRLSYFFDWKGPSMTIDTACSSSLVAVHLAVQSLREGGCRMAVACGTNLIMSPSFFIFASPLNMLSPTGRSRMWDTKADGYARGDGIVAVVLKRLSDAIADGDHIESVIRETSVNQDGQTMGITMPSGAAQAQLIRSTYAKAGLRPDQPEGRCQYFEAHGTGTQAGDPEEASAIADVFFPSLEAKAGKTSLELSATNGEVRSRDKSSFPENAGTNGTGGEQSPSKASINKILGEKLLVGSVKTVVGHTEGAAGLAGLLKASLSIHHGVIVPNLHFDTLNPKIDPFYHNLCIPTDVQLWPELPEGVPRRASVNSFGFGGTNAHAILESYHSDVSKTDHVEQCALQARNSSASLPFVFSASSEQSLATLLHSWSQHLSRNLKADYADLATSLFSRRDAFPHKLLMQASSTEELADKIDKELARIKEKTGPSSSMVRKTSASPKQILVIFTGQGSQWPRMGVDLFLASPQVSRWLEELQVSLDDLPAQYRPHYSLMDELAAAEDSSRLAEAAISQPLCTALQMIQIDLLRTIGFNISAVVGHSSGEIAAAYAAGVLCAADAIRIAHLRGLVAKFAGSGSHAGAMAAAGLSAEDARALCGRPEFRGRVAIAAFNSPQSVTLSGDFDAIGEIEYLLKTQQIFVRVLNVDKGYHSHHMVPCSEPYLAALQSAGIHAQACQSTRWFSSLRPGHEIDDGDLDSIQGSYWVENMLEPVHFTGAIAAAARAIKPDLVVELGPHAALKNPVRLCLSDSLSSANDAEIPYISLLARGKSGLDCFAQALGVFWAVASPDSCSLRSYIDLFGNRSTSMTSMVRTLPTYPFDHRQSYWAESRASAAFAYRPESSHLLLGTPTTEKTNGDWCWRNYLRLEEIPWLRGHKIESQIVFPATGYIAMVVEAAAIIAGTKSLRLIELRDLQIGNAIILKDSSSQSADVEILFKVQDFQMDSSSTRATAKFTCHASFAGGFRPCAHGAVLMTFGDQDQCLLPSRNTPPQELSQMNIDGLYSYWKQLGYGYEDLFRGITKCGRRKDWASGSMINPALIDPESSLIMHPAMMDTLLQGFLAAIGECHDGRLYTLFVPTGISRVTINPFFGGPDGLTDDEVAFEARVADFSYGGAEGDLAIFDLTGNCVLQFDGVKVSPLMAPTEADDRLMFSEIVWGPINPDFTIQNVQLVSEPTSDAIFEAQLAVLYMSQVLEQLSLDNGLRISLEGEKVVRWFHHVIGSVRAGAHPACASDVLHGTIDNVRSKLNASSFTVRGIDVIGDNMIPLLCGETTISEVLQQEDDFIHCLSKELVNHVSLGHMAAVAKQITFRYPHMRVLEVGAGSGSATAAILEGIGQSYYSYTYTDSSPQSFDTAKAAFTDRSSRFSCKVLDMETNPLEQGFAKHSYDLVFATNLPHPTVSLREALARLRSLLKPGGYLIFTAFINPDAVGVAFITCGFKSGWLSEMDSQRYEPTVVLESWEDILRDVGFSGIDSISASDGTVPSSSSVLVSQAVDNRMLRLREPLACAGEIEPKSDNLYIIGAVSPVAIKLFQELQTTLSLFFDKILIAPSLAHPHLRQLGSKSAALILDLDGPMLKNITDSQFETLKLVIDTCHTVLWTSYGSESINPHVGMNNGLLRSVAFENPHALYTHLNIVDSESLQAGTITEQLLRMIFFNSENDYALRNCVWSTEAELRVQNGKTWIPRLKSDCAMNKRYMSSRRLIHDNLDTQKSNVTMTESGELFEANEPAATMAAGGAVSIRVGYSTSGPLRVEGVGLLYFVVGVCSNTNTRVLALTSSCQSVVEVRPSWCQDVPSSICAADEAAYLCGVELSLLSQALLRQAATNSTVIVYGADNATQLAITTSAASLGVRPIFVTTNPENRASSTLSTVHVHRMTSTHELKRALNPYIKFTSVFLDASWPLNTDGGLGERLASLFPSSVHRESLHSLRDIPVQVFTGCKSHEPTGATVFLESVRSEALNLATSQLVPRLVNVQQAAEHNRSFSIIDWTSHEHVEVRLRPSGSAVLLSPTKTYLLAGMTGSLGRSVAEWMVCRGARYLALTSRNPKVEQWWIDEMANLGAKIMVLAMDVTDEASILKVHNTILGRFPKAGGIVNGATVIRDAWLSNMTYADWEDITKPKVQGSIALSEVYSDKDLDFFILMGSISGHIGNRSQSAYAAANAFMSSLISQRRSRGLVGSVISPGPILGVGYVSKTDSKLREQLNDAIGCYNLSEQDLHELFAEAILAGRPEAGRNPDIIAGFKKASPKTQPSIKWYQNAKLWHFVDSQDGGFSDEAPTSGTGARLSIREQLVSATTPAESASIIEAEFIAEVAGRLLLPEASISRETSLPELGVDSIIAVELRSWLAKEAGLMIPTIKMLGDHSIAQLVREGISA
ncbi:hypothetical protein LLEC1_01404 [Akanthomyces lecanii]|uniref:Uncharacterized protein n=1 Tax=Cordyceps confragosa TaxID=2714763 RepID=A0A179ITF3_CORDF|nr:hypothetical protein LLEC1_01404 [Akanthomyces lecanii]